MCICQYQVTICYFEDLTHEGIQFAEFYVQLDDIRMLFRLFCQLRLCSPSLRKWYLAYERTNILSPAKIVLDFCTYNFIIHYCITPALDVTFLVSTCS